ncbi:MAG: adenylate/guanylate cyclase domain-containing protein [Bacteroidota bacterium]
MRWPFILFFSFLLCQATSGQAQSHDLDSLWAIWNDASLPDSQRMKTIAVLANPFYMNRDLDSAFLLADMAEELARQLKDSAWLATSLNVKGVAQIKKGYASLAIPFLKKSVEIRRLAHEEEKRISPLINLGIAYKTNGELALAMNCFFEALHISESLDDRGKIASTKTAMANLYYAQKDYGKAEQLFFEALTIRKELNQRRKMAILNNNLGGLFGSKKEYDKAERHLLESLAIRKELGDSLSMVNPLNNLAIIYTDHMEYEKARQYGIRALTLADQLGDKGGKVYSLITLGNLHKHLKNPQQAKLHFQQALSISEELGSLTMLKGTYNGLYFFHKKIGEHKEALRTYETYIKLTDSLNGQQIKRQILEKELAYAYEKEALADSLEFVQQQALTAQALALERSRRNWLSLGLGIFIILAGVIFWQFLQTKQAKGIAEQEYQRSEELLHNILPVETALELKEKGYTTAKKFDQVTVLFADIKGFTSLAESLDPEELVAEIDTYFRAFDQIILNHGMEKIKTVGDAYIAVGGLPAANQATVSSVLEAAIDIQKVVEDFKQSRQLQGLPFFELRIGLHTGPVVAGVVGIKKFQYDIWGDTVNIAARMEQHGLPGRINVSEDVFELLKENAEFQFESRGSLEVKNKGKMQMYFVF